MKRVYLFICFRTKNVGVQLHCISVTSLLGGLEIFHKRFIIANKTIGEKRITKLNTSSIPLNT